MHPETIAVHAGRMIDPSTGAVSPPFTCRPPSSVMPTANSRAAMPMFATTTRTAARSRPASQVSKAGSPRSPSHPAWPPSAPRWRPSPSNIPGRSCCRRTCISASASLLTETSFGRALDVVSVDMTDLGAVERACAGAKPGIVWAETPSNPLVGITDLAGVARIARAHGAALGVDNTWATPLLQRPLDLRCRSRRAFAHEIYRRA